MTQTLAEAHPLCEFGALVTSFSSGRAPVEERDGNVLGDGHPGDEIEGLKHEPQASVACLGESVVREGGDIVATQVVLAGGGAVQAPE